MSVLIFVHHLSKIDLKKINILPPTTIGRVEIAFIQQLRRRLSSARNQSDLTKGKRCPGDKIKKKPLKFKNITFRYAQLPAFASKAQATPNTCSENKTER